MIYLTNSRKKLYNMGGIVSEAIFNTGGIEKGTYTHACTHTHMYARMHTHVDADECSYTLACMHTHTCLYACTFIYTHTFIHLHPDIKIFKIKASEHFEKKKQQQIYNYVYSK